MILQHVHGYRRLSCYLALQDLLWLVVMCVSAGCPEHSACLHGTKAKRWKGVLAGVAGGGAADGGEGARGVAATSTPACLHPLICMARKLSGGNGCSQVWLEAGRPTVVKGRAVWLLKLRGVDGPEAAEQLNGLFLLGDPAARPALDTDDEFYVQARLHLLDTSHVLWREAVLVGPSRLALCSVW